MGNITDISTRAIEFWREAGAEFWFKKSDDFDNDMREKFTADLAFLETVDLPNHFENSKNGLKILGIIICLDQFRRNLNRGSGLAFAYDEQAFTLSKLMVDANLDDQIDKGLRMFVYMPYMHSENLAVQEKALELFDNSPFAVIHYDLIKAYGRFPHRNQVLGRESTKAELEFLETDGFKG
ncbi:MAG: DUF924 domain-containing protein [Hyphomicrobiales bacterium]